jgi:hypothetical protein
MIARVAGSTTRLRVADATGPGADTTPPLPAPCITHKVDPIVFMKLRHNPPSAYEMIGGVQILVLTIRTFAFAFQFHFHFHFRVHVHVHVHFDLGGKVLNFSGAILWHIEESIRGGDD